MLRRYVRRVPVFRAFWGLFFLKIRFDVTWTVRQTRSKNGKAALAGERKTTVNRLLTLVSGEQLEGFATELELYQP
ncbi:hypothetical protein CHH27_12945 [Labrenzia sp. VG12]|nr:hypothetical protein CHH27_12945 [Labrenzia sp. VG12]